MENNLREYYKDVYLAGGFPYAHQFTPSGKAAGAILAISSIKDAVPVLHGPVGCGFHYRYLCRRTNLPAYDLQCTDLNENDMIMGGAGKLRKTILQTAARFNPPLIAVIPTAPVDMIHDDIENVIHELQPQLAAKLIYVRSERISHADKRQSGRIVFCQTKTECAHQQSDGNLKSCGFSEAMKAVVQNIMKPQPILAGSVNLCGMFLDNSGQALAAGMMEELTNIGATVNAFIPECGVAELETAPRASLNLITWRINWVVKMKEIFGTDYFQVDRNEYGYAGLNGIERLYMQIAGRLGLSQNADAYLTIKKQEVHWSLLKSKAYMNQYSCALCSNDYRNLLKQLRFFKNVLKFNIPYVLVELQQKNYTSIYTMEELKRFAEKFIEEASAEADPDTKWIINPSQTQADAIFSRVDYIAGQDCLVSQNQSTKYIESPRFIPLNFNDFERFVLDYTTRIKMRANNAPPEYFFANKGETEENCANTNASLAFWEKLWIQRG